jgi:hypothetical protein
VPPPLKPLKPASPDPLKVPDANSLLCSALAAFKAAILATDATDAATDACSAAVGGKKPGAAMRVGDDTLTNGAVNLISYLISPPTDEIRSYLI